MTGCLIDIYLDTTVTINHRTIDKWKNQTETSTSYPAKIFKQTNWIKTQSGELKTSNIMFMVKSGTPIGLNDKAVIDSTEYHILKIDEPKFLFCNTGSHMEVYLT